jgi:hypothetical protein
MNTGNALRDHISLNKSLTTNKLPNFPQSLPLDITLLEGEELVAVVVELLFSGCKLGYKLGCKLGCKLGEGVQDADDFRLDGQRFLRVLWAGNGDFFVGVITNPLAFMISIN